MSQHVPKMTLSDPHNTPQHILKAVPMPGERIAIRQSKNNGTEIPGDGPPLLRAPGKNTPFGRTPHSDQHIDLIVTSIYW